MEEIVKLLEQYEKEIVAKDPELKEIINNI